VGENIEVLVKDKGYDHNFVLQHTNKAVSLAATLYERSLQVLTNHPGIQGYTANWWDGSITGSHNIPYSKHAAIAIATQNFPYAPNHAYFPNAVLTPGEIYNTTTIYRFSNW
jgi:aldose 1-epimerase